MGHEVLGPKRVSAYVCKMEFQCERMHGYSTAQMDEVDTVDKVAYYNVGQ